MCAAKPIQGTIGASNRPVYIAADGTITPIAGAIGGANLPIYVNGSGQMVAGNAPIYSNPHATESAQGTIKIIKSATIVGTDANGDLKAGPKSVGSATQPIYLDASGNFVAGNTPIYTIPESMKVPDFTREVSISDRITVIIYRDTNNKVPLYGSQTQSLDEITQINNVLKYDTLYSVSQDCLLKFHTWMHAFKATTCGINLYINGSHAFSYKENDSFKAGINSDITLNDNTDSSDFCAPYSARWAITTMAAVYVKSGTTFKISPSERGVRVINSNGKITGDVAATGVGSWLNHNSLDAVCDGGTASSLNNVANAVAVFNAGFININNCKITQEDYNAIGNNAILAAQSRMLLPVVCIAHPLY